ncbi:hypothetical protein LOK49_LG07G01490 [Camellia lanceoleosa]|uniref:Uncharacterized protein n=1 Tax=Camellia lanceoleosa TaxID=1840588 RepID=A0ACC0H7H5_9ERIC|nr:hypothetical protein LOK49_LG07G01490 [Camellia lanceoleosa]
MATFIRLHRFRAAAAVTVASGGIYTCLRDPSISIADRGGPALEAVQRKIAQKTKTSTTITSIFFSGSLALFIFFLIALSLTHDPQICHHTLSPLQIWVILDVGFDELR